MKVTVLQQFVTSLIAPMREAGASTTSVNNVDKVAAALAPFFDMDLAAFAELLVQSEEYRRTGILPATTGRKKSAAPAVDLAAIENLVREVNSLIDRAGQPGANIVDLDAEFKQLEKKHKMPKNVAIAVAKGVGVTKAVKTKKDALAEITERIYVRFRSAS